MRRKSRHNRECFVERKIAVRGQSFSHFPCFLVSILAPSTTRHRKTTDAFVSLPSFRSIALTFSLLALNWNNLHKEVYCVWLCGVWRNFYFVVFFEMQVASPFRRSLFMGSFRSLRNRKVSSVHNACSNISYKLLSCSADFNKLPAHPWYIKTLITL